MAGGSAAPGASDEAGEVQEREGIPPISLDSLEERHLFEMSKDKVRSRQIQRALVRGGSDAVRVVFEKVPIAPFFLELVHDQYGNYVAQKMLEVADAEQFSSLFEVLKDQLEPLAQDVHGTRAVQKVVEQSIERSRVATLLAALPSGMAESLAKSPTGFHVVARLVESLPAEDVNSVLEQLCGNQERALALGRDQWGCCVMKKCIDRAFGPMREKVVDAIASNALALVQDPYGNYVVQHLIIGQLRSNSNVTLVIDALKGEIFNLCLQKFSSNVLEKCLLNASETDCNKIINEILNPPACKPSEAIRTLLLHPYGNYVLQQALEAAREPQFSLLVELCRPPLQQALREESSEASREERLAGEHAQRLATKLLKKFPALCEGLEVENPAMQGWMPALDPYAMYHAGYEGYWPGASPCDGGFVYQPYAYPPRNFTGKRPGRGQATRGRSQDEAKEGHGRAEGKSDRRAKYAAGDAKDAGNAKDTVSVGRIVGFWPNYVVTYDEVPAPGTAPCVAPARTGRGRTARSGSGKAPRRRAAGPAA
mmetsp:Transcript_16065/g.35252  ORF Transcript_16065/g.35252 Transcript_16065/m.35252 type:complete len:539 (-) Transcript_16065:468-2084(-)